MSNCAWGFVAGEEKKHTTPSYKHGEIVYCQLHECEYENLEAPCKGKVKRRRKHGGRRLCSTHNDSMNQTANRAAKKNANVESAQDEQPVEVVPQVERAGKANKNTAKKRKQVSTPDEQPVAPNESVAGPDFQDDDEGQGISHDDFLSHLGERNSQASPAVKQFGRALFDEDPDRAPVLTKKYSIEAGYGKLALPHKKTQFVGGLKLVMMIDYYYTRAISLEDEFADVADPMDIALLVPLFGCMFNVKTLRGALLTQSLMIDDHVGVVNESKRYGRGRIMLWLPPPYTMRVLAGIVKPIDSVEDYMEELTASTFGLENDGSLPTLYNSSDAVPQTSAVDDWC